MACNSKLAGPKANLIKFWDSSIFVKHIGGTFDLIVFNVIVWSFRCTGLEMACDSDRLSIEQNRLKFGNSGTLVQRTFIWTPLCLEC